MDRRCSLLVRPAGLGWAGSSEWRTTHRLEAGQELKSSLKSDADAREEVDYAGRML